MITRPQFILLSFIRRQKRCIFLLAYLLYDVYDV